MMLPNESFFSKIPALKDFSLVLEDSFYVDVPEDWTLVLTDVKGSTRAIEQGRYKQVNMIGAASITCVLNELGRLEIPFVFGGDGATLLIPSSRVEAVSRALQNLQRISQRDFDLQLRVGLVPVRQLREESLALKVAKYELSPGNNLAQFRGGGLTRAEDMVKKNLAGALILNPSLEVGDPNLEGLSCRLEPLKSRQGQIVSLICKARDGVKEEVLREILEKLKTILADDFKTASPVALDQLKWKWVPPTLKEELQFRAGAAGFAGFLKVLIGAMIANFSLKCNVPLGPFKPEKYKSELVLNSDFKKFDEMIRMVVDCNSQQVEAIEELLRSYWQERKIYYGLHHSKQALMTCMVFSASQNQHIHFIDGAEGGYAFAAAQLKKQMQNENSSPEQKSLV